jgi:peroxiredoxin
MTTMLQRPPVQPGERAPDFRLRAVYADAEVALTDYRGRPLFLAIFLGLWCPFCRRNIAQLGITRDELLACGVETLAVVATELDNARLYFKYRPTRVPLAADPALITHRAYGLPQPQLDQSTMQLLASTRINPTGELPEPVPATEIGPILDSADNFKRNDVDTNDLERQWPMMRAQFLVDHDSIVRWSNVECAMEGLAGIGKFPTTDEVLAATRKLRLAG